MTYEDYEIENYLGKEVEATPEIIENVRTAWEAIDDILEDTESEEYQQAIAGAVAYILGDETPEAAQLKTIAAERELNSTRGWRRGVVVAANTIDQIPETTLANRLDITRKAIRRTLGRDTY